MAIKKYKILLEDSHEYDLTIETSNDKKIIRISYSNLGEWSSHIKGKLAIELVDDGNNIIINSFKLKRVLEFDEAMLLNFVLTLDNKTDFRTGEIKELEPYQTYKVFEETEITKLMNQAIK